MLQLVLGNPPFLAIFTRLDRVAVWKKDNPLPVSAKIKTKKNLPDRKFPARLSSGRALLAVAALVVD